MVIPSAWIEATIESLFVAGGLLAMKLFRRNNKDAAPVLTVMDVFGCVLGGLIFGVLTTFRWNAIRWKAVLVVIIIAYVVAAFIDTLVRTARRSAN